MYRSEAAKNSLRTFNKTELSLSEITLAFLNATDSQFALAMSSEPGGNPRISSHL